MNWFVGVLFSAMLIGCNSPKPESIAAYRAAQRAAHERVAAQETALDASIAEIRAGKWVPRKDLGACTVSMPPLPSEKQGMGSYPAWVFDSPNAGSIAGWSHAGERIFEQLRASIGDPDGKYLPETEKDIVASTARIAAIDPHKEPDFAMLYVDEIHRPEATGDKTFKGGNERGRAWVWSQSKGTVVCASTFESRTSQEVIATYFGHEHRDDETSSSLMLNLRDHSIRSAMSDLVAAGKPTP